MNARMLTGLKIFLISGWTLLVLWNYFRNFLPINLPEILQNGFMLAVLLLFFSALGHRIFRMTSISFGSFAEEIGFSFGIGTGVVIFLLFGLATIGMLYEIVIVAVILFLFALIYSDAKAICFRGYDFLRSLSSQNRSLIDLIFLFLLAIAGSATFFAAATPPFFYDALVYHLAVPQQYLLNHGFRYMPHHHFSNFPMNLGMIFMVGMSFSGGMLAKLLSWVFAPMSALAVYGFAKSRWGRQTALAAAAILFLVPGVMILSILTSVDLGVMFYSFLSFAALITWFNSRQRSWFVLSGIFCGLAVGTKYTALPMTLGAILIILFIHEFLFVKKRRFLHSLRSLLLYGSIVLCMVLPWFAKNTLYTGNPIYPFLNSLIHDQGSDQYTRYDQFLATNNPLLKTLSSLFKGGNKQKGHLGERFLTVIKAPWIFSMKTTRAAGKTGILFLLCLPTVFMIKRLDSSVRYQFAFGGVVFCLWVILFPQTALRYTFQMFPPFSLVTAYLLSSLSASIRPKSWLLGGISVVLGFHCALFFRETTLLRAYTYLLNNESAEQFLLGHGVNYYPAIQAINQDTHGNSTILYVGELRGYYCEREILLSTDGHRIDDEIILRKVILESQNVQEVLQKLSQLKVSHILLNFAEMQRFARGELGRESFFGFQTEQDKDIFKTLFSKYFQLLVSEYEVNAYQILYPENLHDSQDKTF
ncbi:MAG: phospholipid carrier-dependent glycosyltransferase [bacterium]|nr:phospholipid carrier-dependent glycosyltransferase [bacterium]